MSARATAPVLAAFFAVAVLPARAAEPAPDAAGLPPRDDAALARQVDALMAQPHADSPVYALDGQTLYFQSDRDGHPRLYARRLSDGAERPMAPEWTTPMAGMSADRKGHDLMFVADADGNELTQIYTLSTRGGTVRQATREVITRDTPVLPTGRTDVAYYSARRPDADHASIMRLALGKAPVETEVYRDAGLGFLGDVSADGRKGLFLRFLSYQSARLLRVDLDNGSAHALYPRDGEVTIRAAAFSRDGKRVFVATDGGSEQASVLALDAATGDELARYDENAPRTATGEQLLVSPDGRFVAVSLNAGDHQIVRLLDASTLAPAVDVALPLGTGQLGDFSPDGHQLAVVWRTPEHTTSIHVIDTRSGQAMRLSSAQNEPATPGAASTSTIETLTSGDGVQFPVIVTRPTSPGRHPVIVDFHGGPAGSANIGWSLSASLANARDIAYVQPNIRGSGGFGRAFEASDDGDRRRASFGDIDALVDWLRAQPWVDPDRLVVKGSSFGGYLVVQQLAEHPGRWRAGIDQFGIVDFLSFMDTTTGLVRRNYLREIGDPERDRTRLVDLSPLNRVDAIRTPLFIYAGANDPRVPRAQSDMLAARVRANGVPVEYMLAANEGHGAESPSTQRELAIRSMRFVLDALSTPVPPATP